MTLIKLSVLTSILFLFVACQKPFIKNIVSDPDSDIITANHSFDRSGFQKFVLKDSLRLFESDDLKGLHSLSFLQYSGKLIFCTRNGYMYFVDLNDFESARKIQFGDGIDSAPTIAGSTLFVPVSKGRSGLVAYNMLTSEINWKIDGMNSVSSPVIWQTSLIHATTNGRIISYDTQSGKELWEFRQDDNILNNLAMVNNNLIVATQNGIIRSYNPENGMLNWSLNINDAVYASPVCSEKYVYIATYNGKILQIDFKTGTQINSKDYKTEMFQTPSLDDYNLYIALADGRIIALNRSSLKEVWTQQLKGPFSSSPFVGSAEVIASTMSRFLYRMDKFNGQVIQKIKLGGRSRSQPLFNNNKLYVSYEPDILAIFSGGEFDNE